jgi:hypothetical protein
MIKEPESLSDQEIQRRMEVGIRRALNTPPKPTKGLVGKTKRAKTQKQSRAPKRSPKEKG